MTETPRIAALIVAAGVGARAGGERPKQYQSVAGKPIICHSVVALLAHPAISAVQVVMHPEHAAYYRETFPESQAQLLPPIHGGAQRTDSVRAGLKALVAHSPDYVLIHDAARPFLSSAVIDRIVAALAPDTGVVPTLAVHDTVRRFSDGAWEEVPRAGLMRIQTPQAFPFASLAALYASHASATDDAALWLAAGRKLAYVEGDEDLDKMTTASDIAKKQNARRTAVGMGFDVHALIPSTTGTMRIGGIDIASDFKLEGHSDADVALHAITDALLGTIADGDIGAHYSPKDDRWKDADSAVFLQDTLKKVQAVGGAITHIDVTIICEAPTIGPHRDAMRARIAELLSLNVNRVSVKATTTERLGFTGRGEGVAAQAVATVTLPEGV